VGVLGLKVVNDWITEEIAVLEVSRPPTIRRFADKNLPCNGFGLYKARWSRAPSRQRST
jgi:hypothetical protein